MILRTAFLHMERSEAVEQFAQEKIGSRIEKLTDHPIQADLAFLVEKDQHIVRLTLKEGKRKRLTVRETAPDMYRAILQAAATIDRRLRQEKKRRLAKRHATVPEETLLAG